MHLSDEEKKAMLRQMQDSFIRYHQREEYMKNISIDDLLKEINQLGFQYTEQDILDKYQEYMSVTDTDDYFFKRDQMSWEAVDDKAQMLNSDALLQLICKIVKKHYDVETICDPWFIMERIDALDDVPKNEAQEKILGIIESIVEYGKLRHINSVEEIMEDYDMNAILKDQIRRCHQRDAHFKQVIKSYYDTFIDADHSIYKIK